MRQPLDSFRLGPIQNAAVHESTIDRIFPTTRSVDSSSSGSLQSTTEGAQESLTSYTLTFSYVAR